MKKLVIGLLPFVLMSYSMMASAEKLIITGSPVVVEKRGEVYYPPNGTVINTQSEYFFNVDNTKRVCYTVEKPTLHKVNMFEMNMFVAGTQAKLYCYDYNPTYFSIEK